MKWSPDRIIWRDFETSDKDFSQLLTLLKKKPILFRISTILISKYPNFATHEELGVEWSEVTIASGNKLRNLVTVNISALNKIIESHGLPLEIKNLHSLGYCLVKKGQEDITLLWEKLSTLEMS